MDRYLSLGLARHLLPQLANELTDLLDPDVPLTLGRATSGAHGHWRLLTPDGPAQALAPGPLRGDIAVGDWLVVQTDLDPFIVLRRLDRGPTLRRRDPDGGEQVLAANVEVAWICTAVGPELNLRRLERWLSIARACDVDAEIVLTKCDLGLSAELEDLRALGAPVHAISALEGSGLDALRERVRGHTAALLGSSGVGKSTLLNVLTGHSTPEQATRQDGKGRHTTTWRALHAVSSGGWVIDNPGVREVGLLTDAGVADVFADVEVLTERCAWRDCDHSSTEGCAVLEAVDAGSLDSERLSAWRKLKREGAYQAAKGDRLAEEARKQHWKRIHLNMRARRRFEDS